MPLNKEEIKSNLNLALKEKKEIEVSVLRQLLAVVLDREKKKKFRDHEQGESQLTEEELAEVISSEAKKRKEAIESFKKGDRYDLAEIEKNELEILKKYLPEQLSENKLKELAEEAISKTGAETIKDIGKVMAELMPKTRGRADGALISKIVKELLG
jgi:uncharacterized protein